MAWQVAGRSAHAPYAYRDDAGVPPFDDARPVIVFDGDCVLCSWWARFVLRRDRRRRFRLLPAGSRTGQALYRHFGLDPESLETHILIEDGRAAFGSEAIIRILEGFGGAWSLARALRILPVPFRDFLYRRLARSRYRFFGRREACYLEAGPVDPDRIIG